MGNFRVDSRFARFMNGKGFYIALAICLVAVGSAAYIAASSSYGLLNNNAGSSAAPSQQQATPNVAWDTGSETAQANNAVSNVPKESSKASSAAASQQTKTSSELTNDKGEKLVFMLPVNGEIITSYSNNAPVYDKTMDDWRVHNAVDISAKAGTPVSADADGKVSEVTTDPLLGTTVKIDHGNGIVSTFANLSKDVTVKKSQQVNAGDIIGCVGQTAQAESLIAPHLHYSMTKDGVSIDPLSFVKQS